MRARVDLRHVDGETPAPPKSRFLMRFPCNRQQTLWFHSHGNSFRGEFQRFCNHPQYDKQNCPSNKSPIYPIQSLFGYDFRVFLLDCLLGVCHHPLFYLTQTQVEWLPFPPLTWHLWGGP